MSLMDGDTYKRPDAEVLPLITPAAARGMDGDKYTALHWAAENSSSVAVVLALLAAYPEAAEVREEYGRTPLHIAASDNSSVAVVRALLAAYPEAATATDNVRRHHPCCRVHQRPSAVIRGSSDVIKGNQVYTFALRGQ